MCAMWHLLSDAKRSFFEDMALADKLNIGLFAQWPGWEADWWMDRLMGWLVEEQSDSLEPWLTSWLQRSQPVSHLDWLATWLAAWLAADRITDRSLTDWLTDWLTAWLYWFHFSFPLLPCSPVSSIKEQEVKILCSEKHKHSGGSG